MGKLVECIAIDSGNPYGLVLGFIYEVRTEWNAGSSTSPNIYYYIVGFPNANFMQKYFRDYVPAPLQIFPSSGVKSFRIIKNRDPNKDLSPGKVDFTEITLEPVKDKPTVCACGIFRLDCTYHKD